MYADFFYTGLTGAVVESPFDLRVCGPLQNAGLLQLVLVVQQSICELLHLEKIIVSLHTQQTLHSERGDFFHLYDSDLAVVFLDGLVEILHQILKLVRFLVDSGCVGQV